MRWKVQVRRLTNYGEVRAVRRFCWFPTVCQDRHRHWLESVWRIEVFECRDSSRPEWNEVGVHCEFSRARAEFMAALKLKYVSGLCRRVSGSVAPDSELDASGAYPPVHFDRSAGRSHPAPMLEGYQPTGPNEKPANAPKVGTCAVFPKKSRGQS